MKSGWLTQKPLCPLYYLDLRQFSSCLETTAAATAERSEIPIPGHQHHQMVVRGPCLPARHCPARVELGEVT